MPIDIGSTTPSTAAVATAASAALPPRRSTSMPASVARGWLHTTMPLLPKTVDRGCMERTVLLFWIETLDELLARQTIDDRVVGERLQRDVLPADRFEHGNRRLGLEPRRLFEVDNRILVNLLDEPRVRQPREARDRAQRRRLVTVHRGDALGVRAGHPFDDVRVAPEIIARDDDDVHRVLDSHVFELEQELRLHRR